MSSYPREVGLLHYGYKPVRGDSGVVDKYIDFTEGGFNVIYPFFWMASKSATLQQKLSP
jgi:hypothetical protein